MRSAGRRTAILAASVALMAACSSSSPSDVRAGSVYETVLRWFADRDADDPDPLPVFIEPRGEGTSIDLAVQAEVVEWTAEYADARFIDSRDEALLVDQDGVTAVRDGGVLVRLGPVLEDGKRVTLDVDVFVDDATQQSLRFDLAATGDDWRVIGEPTEP